MQKYNKFENRYEAHELKWLADFIVNNLIFLRSDLKMKNSKACSMTLQVFWDTLDLFANEAKNTFEDSLHNRMEILRNGMVALYTMQVISKQQVGECLEYCRRTLFSHLQLYLTCLG